MTNKVSKDLYRFYWKSYNGNSSDLKWQRWGFGTLFINMVDDLEFLLQMHSTGFYPTRLTWLIIMEIMIVVFIILPKFAIVMNIVKLKYYSPCIAHTLIMRYNYQSWCRKVFAVLDKLDLMTMVEIYDHLQTVHLKSTKHQMNIFVSWQIDCSYYNHSPTELQNRCYNYNSLKTYLIVAVLLIVVIILYMTLELIPPSATYLCRWIRFR